MDEKIAQMQKSFILPRLAALQGLANWPDAAVPCRAQMNELIPELCKLPYDYLFRDNGAAMAECSLLVWEYVGVDLLIANLDIYNFESEVSGAKMVFYPDHLPDIDRSDFLVKSPADLEKIRFNGLDSGRLPYLLDYAAAWTRLCGLDYSPTFCAPWSLACSLFGLENLLVACLTEPLFAHELLRRCVDDLLGPMIAALSQKLPGITTISLADAWFSPPMVSVDMVAEFMPYIARISEASGLGLPVTNAGIWGYMFLCGEDLERFCDQVSSMVGSLSVMDPDVENMDPVFFRQAATSRNVPLSLGVSTSLMQTGSIDELVDRIKRYVLAGKAGPTPLTFVFNNIGPHTPIENIFAGLAALRIYGAPEANDETLFVMPEVEPFEDFLERKLADNTVGYAFEWLSKSGYAHIAR
ncbi:MAG: uroporphyrinogen decarboxylase family protein [Coriobacteriales bacterium]|jgi:hypothetical protein|nr:uroporphyrinogen decarboxylase family protein [Coriobacteriales bacterium]